MVTVISTGVVHVVKSLLGILASLFLVFGTSSELPFQLLANALGKQQSLASCAWSSWHLTLAWPTTRCCKNFQNELIEWRYIFLSLSLCLANKHICIIHLCFKISKTYLYENIKVWIRNAVFEWPKEKMVRVNVKTNKQARNHTYSLSKCQIRAHIKSDSWHKAMLWVW